MLTLPVVDLGAFRQGSAAERVAAVQRFGDAFRIHGFATLGGHGVPRSRFDAVFEEAARFFALPVSDKRALVVPGSDGNRGYVPFGGERALGAAVHDLKEFFHIGPERIRPEHAAYYQANVWPEGPALARFREVTLALYAELEAVAATALRALALYLDRPEDELATMASGGNSVLRLIHYPAVSADAPAGAVRAAAHEDINLITLLAESTTGGLEVKTREGEFVPVASLEGQLVVNAGDMLQLVSGGRIPSTTHRVVNPRGANTPRYSAPFFTHPRPEVELVPGVRAHDFLTERLRAIAAG